MMQIENTNLPQINIVLLFCELRTGHFGMGTFSNSLVPFLNAQKNINITIVKTDSNSVTETTFLVEDGIEVLYIPRPENKLMIGFEDIFIQKLYAKRAAEIIFTYIHKKPNLLIWVNTIDYINLAVALNKILPECKLMYVHHAFSWKDVFNISDKKFGEIWLKKDSRFTLPLWACTTTERLEQMQYLCNLTIAVTYHASTFFQNYLDVPKRCITIYNGRPIPKEVKFDKNKLREFYGFNKYEKIILYCGRITELKGLPYLLQAFKILADKHKDVRLLVVGSGMNLCDYISYVEPYYSRVTVCGPIKSKKQIEDFYKISDVGVQPSLSEQCSFTAIEMRFHKLPMIVSSDVGLDEMFVHEIDALKVEVIYDEEGIKRLNPIEISEKIERLILNPTLAKKLSTNSYNKALKLFTLEKMQTSYLENINKLFEQK